MNSGYKKEFNNRVRGWERFSPGTESLSTTLVHDHDLSPRECEIVRLVAKGLPNKTIAAILDISPYTVQTYLRRMFDKKQVRTRAALVAVVITTRE